MIGATVSHYRVMEKLGEGGMGVVYKAEDTRLKRTVALKFLPAAFSVDPDAKARFMLEAEAASALQNSNICTVHDIDETGDGQSFIVMDFYEGQTLKKKIEDGPLPLSDAIDIALQVARGLQAADEAGIVHRDIKPANIMVTSKGEAKILDFGLAKLTGQSMLTRTGSTLGTAAYMSPEQARGETADHRSDIWSLGVLLYEMLTGNRPFDAEYENAQLYSIINAEPAPITGLRTCVPMELEHIVRKCLSKSPKERYQHADELAVALRQLRNPLSAVLPSIRTDLKAAQGDRRFLQRFAARPFTILLGGIVVGIVVVVLGYELFVNRPTQIDSIAVLPFENVGADPKAEYLSDGFTESLINSLSTLPGVKLMSRNSVFQFKGRDIDPQQAGKDLGVGAVLTGRLTQHGDELMISVELVDVKDNSHIWGNQYERKLSDMLSLQSDISKAISSQLMITLTGDQQRALVAHPTENADAYKLYLQGLFYWNKRTKDGFEKAVNYYQQAISHDPSYALAYAGLASVYITQGGYFIIPTKESIEKARVLALKALQLDERLAEAHTVLATLSDSFEWNWTNAEREYQRAIYLNPNYATAHQWYGEFLCSMRRFDEGLAQQRRAIEVDPLSPVTYSSAAYGLMVQKRYDEAMEMVIKSLELNPTFPRSLTVRGQISLLVGKPQEALKDMRAIVALSDSGDEYVAYLGHALGLTGNHAEATTLLHTLLKRQHSRYVDPSLIAVVYIGLGEKDQVFQWLHKAYDVRSNLLEYLLIDPLYDPIRSDPQFAALVTNIGLPQ